MKMLKFGGSSVSSPDRIRNVITLIKKQHDQGHKFGVVVSAFGGVTDRLILVGQLALEGSYAEPFSKLKEQHYSAARELLSEERIPGALEKLDMAFEELENAVKGVHLIKELSKRTLDLVMSFGERLSAFIISEALQSAISMGVFLDARLVVRTDKNYGNARVHFEKTNSLVKEWFKNHDDIAVISGFIGASESGDTTTLGRGGSDYTAAIIGSALGVSEIEIWTDVDGVMTADPRKVKQAFPIPQISYKEALEMSHFGAKVIHPPTIAPALNNRIPLWIKNTFNPDANGTYITFTHDSKAYMICGISSIDQVALLRVEGSGMIGVCGISMRLFGALAKKEINIILISQGSSEHSICFAVAPQQSRLAKDALEEEFSLEMQAGLIDPIVVEENLSIIAAVGENMRKTPGIAGRLFGALGKNGINVVAMVQGSSEYNISIVIKRQDETKALNVIHEEFFLSQLATAHVFLVGVGLIGSTLLAQIAQQAHQLRVEHSLDIKVVAIAGSKKMKFNPNGLDLALWKDELEASFDEMNIQEYVRKMKEMNLSRCIFVDCTASDEVASLYTQILGCSISIVTPNKKAISGSYSTYQRLNALTLERGVKFLYETNVGAGLPIISTITDLRRSGDKITKVEAILSGTLSYIFNAFQKGAAFSASLKEAQEKGFTEPDPREDLSGQDVMRKLLILARESGYPLEISDIQIEHLLPEECFEVQNVDEFFRKLEKYDAYFAEKRELAASKGKVLRYIAHFEKGVASIGLKEVDAMHPFYFITGSDNIISITTERYKETPLVIKGQGAGAEVTAGEVFADIIRIAAH